MNATLRRLYQTWFANDILCWHSDVVKIDDGCVWTLKTIQIRHVQGVVNQCKNYAKILKRSKAVWSGFRCLLGLHFVLLLLSLTHSPASPSCQSSWQEWYQGSPWGRRSGTCFCALYNTFVIWKLNSLMHVFSGIWFSHWQESRSRKISRRNDSLFSRSLEKTDFSFLFLFSTFKIFRKNSISLLDLWDF